MLKIAVAGTGYVGLVAGVCFAEKGHDVTCVDLSEDKINMLKSGISPIYEQNLDELLVKNNKNGRLHFTTNYREAYHDANAVFIGVGTPECEDGSADLSYITEVALQIAESVERDCLVVVKSTVPVGTNDKIEEFIKNSLIHDVRIEVASNPEFLAQGTAVRDTLSASRVVIGTESRWAEELLLEIYEPFHLPVLTMKRRSAEMVKYASNNFLALKISYMNDIANICELVRADIKDVARGMSYDARIGDKFLNAGIGYGGSCFPKDTKALNYIAEQNGYHAQTIKAAIEVNRAQKIKLFHKAFQRVLSFKNMKTAILGLTFKPGTDDLREAPSIDNVSLLLQQGAELYAYDPIGAESFKKKFPDNINYVNHPEQALEQADICFIFTEWDDIRSLTPDSFRTLMKTPLVYDGRNLYETDEMKRAGVEYYSIGRSY